MLSDSRAEELKRFCREINAQNVDLKLLDIALTHPSYVFDHHGNHLQHYERLEFLGDSILKNITAQYLYEKFPDYTEGQLANFISLMVSDDFLSILADKIKLSSYIQVGASEKSSNGANKKSIKACAFEAMLAAISESNERIFVNSFLRNFYEENIELIKEKFALFNAKCNLQEYTQAIDNKLPEYKLINQVGEAHELEFEIAVVYNNIEIGRAIAKSKKEAEKLAAFEGLKTLKKKLEK